jgi:hypothetical protein
MSRVNHLHDTLSNYFDRFKFIPQEHMKHPYSPIFRSLRSDCLVQNPRTCPRFPAFLLLDNAVNGHHLVIEGHSVIQFDIRALNSYTVEAEVLVFIMFTSAFLLCPIWGFCSMS